MGLALATVFQSLSNRRMCAIGQTPRVLGPLPLVFSVYYLVEQIFVPFSIVIFAGLLVWCHSFSCRGVTKIGKAMLMAVCGSWRCICVAGYPGAPHVMLIRVIISNVGVQSSRRSLSLSFKHGIEFLLLGQSVIGRIL
jgi:hypothetical protein